MRRCCRLGMLLCAAALVAGVPLAQAQEPDLASVAATLDLALDQGDGPRVLTVLGDAAGTAPGQAADLAAIGTRLAPWMAADIAATVLAAVPPQGRDATASLVLAAVLTAGQGRLSGQILAAVGSAAPQADPAVLRDLARRLSVDGGTTVDGDLVLADLAADGVAAPVLGAVQRARRADLMGRQVIARLPTGRQQDRAERVGRTPPDLPQSTGGDNLQPRVTELPRLPDPRRSASPS